MYVSYYSFGWNIARDLVFRPMVNVALMSVNDRLSAAALSTILRFLDAAVIRLPR